MPSGQSSESEALLASRECVSAAKEHTESRHGRRGRRAPGAVEHGREQPGRRREKDRDRPAGVN